MRSTIQSLKSWTRQSDKTHNLILNLQFQKKTHEVFFFVFVFIFNTSPLSVQHIHLILIRLLPTCWVHSNRRTSLHLFSSCCLKYTIWHSLAVLQKWPILKACIHVCCEEGDPITFGCPWARHLINSCSSEAAVDSDVAALGGCQLDVCVKRSRSSAGWTKAKLTLQMSFAQFASK